MAFEIANYITNTNTVKTKTSAIYSGLEKNVFVMWGNYANAAHPTTA